MNCVLGQLTSSSDTPPPYPPTAPFPMGKVCVYGEYVQATESLFCLLSPLCNWMAELDKARQKEPIWSCGEPFPETKHGLISLNCASSVYVCVCVNVSHLLSGKEKQRIAYKTKGKQKENRLRQIKCMLADWSCRKNNEKQKQPLWFNICGWNKGSTSVVLTRRGAWTDWELCEITVP